MPIAKGRCIYFGISFLAGVAAAALGQPLIHGNSNATGIIVTVFSVLAGFLVGIIALIGEPSAVASRNSWRFTELNRQGVSQRLARNRWMFLLYLLTLTLIFVASLLEKIAEPWVSAMLPWLERTYLGLAVMAFIVPLWEG